MRKTKMKKNKTARSLPALEGFHNHHQKGRCAMSDILCVDSLVSRTSVFQTEDRGAIPTSTLQFSKCKLKDVSKFVKEHHYSHTHPGGVDFSFRLDWNGQLAGACLFGWMAGNPKAMHYRTATPDKTRELMRLVLLDEVPKNSESQFIGWCLRWLKKNTDLNVIVSFADPAFGHSGVIYKATNWKYLGKQKPDRPRIIVDGKEIHPRMCLDKFGGSSVKHIESLGHKVELRIREPKHKFIYVLKEPEVPTVTINGYAFKPYGVER